MSQMRCTLRSMPLNQFLNTYQKIKRYGVPLTKSGLLSISHSNGGYNVVRSHIDDEQDFFEYEPDDYDIIVSNPPFTIKDKILERLYELEKPFAILLPLNSLQGQSRFKYFEQGLQLLSFDQRIGYHNVNSMDKTVEGSPFATAYFCRNLLPRDLIIEKLGKFDRSLIGSD